jgi:HPt (histidine-containing phosphotransfer) domain-containing protein
LTTSDRRDFGLHRAIGTGDDVSASADKLSEKLWISQTIGVGVPGADKKADKVASHVDREALLERLGGDTDLLSELIGIFHQHSADVLARLHVAALSGDAAGAERAAHTLKGMLAQLSADGAAQTASRLEQMGRAGRLDDMPDTLRVLEQQVAVLRPLLLEIAEAAR